MTGPVQRSRAVLVDVGGTLWPDRWPSPPGEFAWRCDRLCAALPGLTPARAGAVLARLERAGAALAGQVVQDVDVYVGDTLRYFQLGSGPGDIAAVLNAVCVPAETRIRLFTGARELLATIRSLGLKCVIVSNAVWRDAAAYWRDFTALGVAGLLDAVVSSVDAGVRKPDPGIFSHAAAAARVPLQSCIMIGNSEILDIRPARSLGIRTLRVAIGEPPPVASAAEQAAGSLAEAAATLRAWG